MLSGSIESRNLEYLLLLVLTCEKEIENLSESLWYFPHVYLVRGEEQEPDRANVGCCKILVSGIENQVAYATLAL